MSQPRGFRWQDATDEEREAFRRARQQAPPPTPEPDWLHDPLCKEHTDGGAYYCVCDLIARARSEGPL